MSVKDTVMAVSRLPGGSGGGATLTTKAVTANGTYAAADDNADGYSSVTVNVQGSSVSVDDVCMRNWPSGDVVINADSIMNPFMDGNANITSVFAANVANVTNYCFRHLTNARHIVLPAAKTLGNNSVDFCTKLEGLDVLGGGEWQSMCLAGNTAMVTLVIRKTGSIQVASQSNMFNSTATTAKPLHVYVPQALKATYESATNWSTWVASGTVVFEDLEGSVYETQYVDGTPIPTT
jgi:hypothetical protein